MTFGLVRVGMGEFKSLKSWQCYMLGVHVFALFYRGTACGEEDFTLDRALI